MDTMLELIKEAPHVVIICVVIFALLPCIAKIIECFFGFILTLVALFMKRKDIPRKETSVKINFRGIKLEIGQSHLVDKDNAEDAEDAEDGEQTLLNHLNEKVIEFKKSKRK